MTEEDIDLNRRVKAALESKGAFRLRVRPRRGLGAWRWVVPSALAASVALAAVLHAVFAVGQDGVAETICLLCEADGLDVATAYATTSEDLLLTWQDAPYDDCLSGLN